MNHPRRCLVMQQFTERDAMRFYAQASNPALACIQLRIAHFARLATQGLAKADMRKLVESESRCRKNFVQRDKC